ncbi:ATP-dependent zinc metalloprotease FtsH [Patescibacteria group bacterium]|nr:ATP-dependent zinc metalloprotease FtsH [Patescibacteria group bacterium]
MATKKETKKKQVKKFELKLKFNPRRLLVWFLVIFLFLPSLLGVLGESSGLIDEIALSEAIEEIRSEQVEKVEIRGDELVLYYPEVDGVPVLKLARKEEGTGLVDILQGAGIDENNVKIEVVSQTLSKAFWGMVSLVAPILGFGLILYFLSKRQMGSGPGGMFGIGKSGAKLFVKGKQSERFSSVAGVDEAKKELEEVVDFLKNPKKYKAVGARTPKGVLLIGPSGVGKTLLARAVAGEAGVPFLSMAGSEFMEMLVGVGASRVRDLFATAKKMAPAIIFIDEIDAIGRSRGIGTMGGHDEREQTLNQILVEMDGFTANDNVIVVAATNRPDVLDSALVRPGRFDRRVSLDLPDIADRKEIIKIHAKGKPFVDKLRWERVAEMTVGFSGADLENMLNEAAILTARRARKKIGLEDIREAATKVKLGPEKKRLQSKREREMTAYHEAGHAVVGHMLPGADPIHTVSIVSRELSLGHTESRPNRDRYQYTLSELKDRLAVMMGGRAAERVVYNELSGGAASDIDGATKLARKMVVDLGMSKLGPVALGSGWEPMGDMGRGFMRQVEVSDRMQSKIDDEIKLFIDEAYNLAEVVLKKNKVRMKRLVTRLLKVETIETDEFLKIMDIKKAIYDEKIGID